MDHLVRELNYLISQLTKLLTSTDDHFRGLCLILETELVGYKVPNCLNWNPSQGGLAGLEGRGERGGPSLPCQRLPHGRRGVQAQEAERAPSPARSPSTMWVLFQGGLFPLGHGQAGELQQVTDTNKGPEAQTTACLKKDSRKKRGEGHTQQALAAGRPAPLDCKSCGCFRAEAIRAATVVVFLMVKRSQGSECSLLPGACKSLTT